MGHCRQDVEPLTDVKVPAEHSVQLEAPVTALKLPKAHLIGDVIVSEGHDEPGGQGRHSPPIVVFGL